MDPMLPYYNHPCFKQLFIPSPDNPLLPYDLAELTWDNGQIALHGMAQQSMRMQKVAELMPEPSYYVLPGEPGPPMLPPWDRLCSSETLEAIVGQATRPPQPSAATVSFEGHVPGQAGSHTQVASCSNASKALEKRVRMEAYPPLPPPPPPPPPLPAAAVSLSGTSNTFGYCPCPKIMIPCGRNFESVLAENESSGKSSKRVVVDVDGGDNHDSFCHSRPQAASQSHRESEELEDEEEKKKGKSSVSTTTTKRTRAAAVHNQSERKRRDKINEKMKTLQQMVPNSCKTDKASMLDEVIEYLKQLQAQVQMMSRVTLSLLKKHQPQQQQQLQPQLQQLQMPMPMPMHMPMPMPMPMPMMNPMAEMDMPRPDNLGGMPPPMHQNNPFMPMPMPPWDAPPATAGLIDPVLASLLACQAQLPGTSESQNRMASMYQQLPAPGSTSTSGPNDLGNNIM